MKITIETGVADSKVKEIAEFLENEILRNPDLNGAEYEIVRGEYTGIDDIDEYTGATLLSAIVDIINQ
jgi:hypothetical protein